MSLKKIIIIIIAILIVIFLVVYFMVIRKDSSNQSKTNQQTAQDSDAQEVTNLTSVGPIEGNGSGTATRQIKSGAFIHTITAEIPEPASDKFYEGWLVKGSEYFSTGKLSKKDNQFILDYQSPKDKTSYSRVVVTLETLSKGLDDIPETHVLEGSF